jgi:tetratricopeptide (TPR) repeat protein
VKPIERLAIVLALVVTTGFDFGLSQPHATPESLRNAALGLEQQGRTPEAEATWQALLQMSPRSPEAYAHLGLLEARQEHYKEAVSFYRKAFSLDPTMPELRLNLGLALFKSGELQQAIDEFKALLNAQPLTALDSRRLTILIGMAHYGLGEFAKAAPYLREAAAQDPRNLQLRLALAHSCLWSKQYQCVLDVYHEILTLNADSAEADMLAGEALDEMKQYDGAIQQFRAAVKADPAEPNVHFGLGYLLWTQRQYSEAAQEFQAELANDPNQLQALAYLADTQMQLNHPEAALPLLKKVERADPARSLVHLDLGILYVEDGRQEDALHELTTAARLAPDDVNVHWRLARLFKAMGRKNEAKVEFDKASSLHKATDDSLLEKMNGGRAETRRAPQLAPAPAEK